MSSDQADGTAVQDLPPRHIAYSSTHAVQHVDHPLPDIDVDRDFARIFAATRDYTMTHKDTMYSLYSAVRYVVENDIPGDFVECGVWRGGSALVAALTLRVLGANDRKLHLFDTYEGMTAPTAHDVDWSGQHAGEIMDAHADGGKWCYADLDDVQAQFRRHGFTSGTVNFIVGDVEKTLPSFSCGQIAILRLDTDWYASTKAELEILYPSLSLGGVLIIDDYGHWKGSREAVDEYFATRRKPLLNRINYGVRTAIKITD